jgi:hypothetical protein
LWHGNFRFFVLGAKHSLLGIKAQKHHRAKRRNEFYSILRWVSMTSKKKGDKPRFILSMENVVCPLFVTAFVVWCAVID